MNIEEEVDRLGRSIYREAKADPSAPLEGGAVALAVRILGKKAIYEQPHALNLAKLSRIGDRMTIVLRKGLAPARANWLTGHELSHLFLDGSPLFRCLGADEREVWCDALGSWLCAPPTPFREAMRAGLQLRRVARVFSLSETAIALRVGECGVRPGVTVVTADRVRQRGRAMFASEADARLELARARPRRAKRLAIRDEPCRAALVA